MKNQHQSAYRKQPYSIGVLSLACALIITTAISHTMEERNHSLPLKEILSYIESNETKTKEAQDKKRKWNDQKELALEEEKKLNENKKFWENIKNHHQFLCSLLQKAEEIKNGNPLNTLPSYDALLNELKGCLVLRNFILFNIVKQQRACVFLTKKSNSIRSLPLPQFQKTFGILSNKKQNNLMDKTITINKLYDPTIKNYITTLKDVEKKIYNDLLYPAYIIEREEKKKAIDEIREKNKSSLLLQLPKNLLIYLATFGSIEKKMKSVCYRLYNIFHQAPQKTSISFNWNGYYVLYCNKQDSIDQISQSQAKKVYLTTDPSIPATDPNNQSHNNLKNLDITHLIIECPFKYVKIFSIFSPEKKFEFVSLDTIDAIAQDNFEFLKNINSQFLEIKKILLYPDLENIDLLDDILLNRNGSKHMKIRLQLHERSMGKNIFKLLPKFFTYAAFLNSSKSFASLKEYIDSAPQSFLSFCNILKEQEDIKNIISTHEKNDRTILLKIDHRMVFKSSTAMYEDCSASHRNAIETTISYYKKKSSLFFCFIESFYPFFKKTFTHYQEALLYLDEIEKAWLNYQYVFFKNNECVTSYDLKNHFVGAFIFGEYNNVFLKFELIKGD